MTPAAVEGLKEDGYPEGTVVSSEPDERFAESAREAPVLQGLRASLRAEIARRLVPPDHRAR